MQLTLLKGYPDMVGRRRNFCGYGTGPSSYSQTTGDVLAAVGYEVYFDNVFPTAQDPTGTYYAQPRPNAVGPELHGLSTGSWLRLEPKSPMQ